MNLACQLKKNIWTWISIKCIEKGLINKIAFWGQGQSARSEPTILDGFDWKWTFQDKDIGRSGEIVETLDPVSRSKSNIEKINRHFRRDISFVYQCIWIRVNDGLIDSFDFKSFKLFRLNILRKILLLQSICFSNNKICIYSAWNSRIHSLDNLSFEISVIVIYNKMRRTLPTAVWPWWYDARLRTRPSEFESRKGFRFFTEYRFWATIL